ncbi:vomeronasal type-2 receptor 26-like [Lithobates pipiens]
MKCSPVFCVCLLPILIIPITSYGEALTRRSASACRLDRIKPWFEHEYYQKGYFIIGGLVSAHLFSKFTTKIKEVRIGLDGSKSFSFCTDPDIEEYISILAMMALVNQINNDLNILPNVTLGYHIFSTCNDPMKTLGYAIKILSGEKEAPNYYCRGRGEVVGFIGDSSRNTNQALAQLLNLYRYTQITYRVIDTPLSDRKIYPTLFRAIPDDRVHYAPIFTLLRHLRWNWVGIFSSDDGNGDEESQELSNMMSQHGICTSYIIPLIGNIENDIQKLKIVRESTAKVVIVCGPYTHEFHRFASRMRSVIGNITFIFPPSWSKITIMFFDDITLINCSFIFLWSPKCKLDKNTYSHSKYPKRLHDPIMDDILIFTCKCLSTNLYKNDVFKIFFKHPYKPCPNSTDWSFLNTFTVLPSFAYLAVYLLARALHGMYMMTNNSKLHGFQHKLHKYVRNVHYRDGTNIHFNEKNENPTKLYLISVLCVNRSHLHLYKVSTLLGPDYVPETFPNMSNPRFWKTGKVPVSLCSDPCLPGSRKKYGSSIHKCCYECVPCPEGEISNISDSENCMKCPDDEWPNEKKDRCVSKLVEFLSYTDDTIVAVFSPVSILCCLLTGLILRLFIHYRDTPIVKANNRNLSYLLLVSIMLSFLCVFLFLGRPVDVTCMLRVTSFGVIFSVAVSSLLAKSIMVCIAFKATKPGSPWRKWMGTKLPNCIICVFSLVQVIICVSWLSISPPFQDQDTHSYQGKIIIQCNEGSVIGFYSVLGYMGLLAAVSFIISFLARTLPDSFNEAKYITFSMLVFCSVWIAMIPAYLSTRGKYMVAVEVFAIMASSSGLLGCIFFYKCYQILFRPDLNVKIVIH